MDGAHRLARLAREIADLKEIFVLLSGLHDGESDGVVHQPDVYVRVMVLLRLPLADRQGLPQTGTVLRTWVLVVAILAVALLNAITLVPRSEPREASTTEQIRTSHVGHHHATMASLTDDGDDDDDDDDDDDVLASGMTVAIAPMVLRPHAEIVFAIDDVLGPSSAHDTMLERPPRA